jgi:RNA polymerase sigma-70 factor (ECF subfamily)
MNIAGERVNSMNQIKNSQISAQSLRQLRRMASRRAHSVEEADDLVQDVLIAALETGRDCDGPQFFAWASGVLKHRALFLARSAGRRRRRDANFAMDVVEAALPTSARSLPRAFVESLPLAVRTVAWLVNVGLGRAEIAVVLGISDLALRQRISVLRKAWKMSRAHHDFIEPPRWARPPCGLLRRSLKTTIAKLPSGRAAIADPDGHGIFLKVAHDLPVRGN